MNEPDLSQDNFFKAKKGRNNEERFRHILSDQTKTPSWISRVVDTGEFDDRKRGIDFFVFTTTGWKIPVDVKSSVRGMRGHVEKRGSKGVCIIVMDSRLDDDVMRMKIIEFIGQFIENRIKDGSNNDFKA